MRTDFSTSLELIDTKTSLLLHRNLVRIAPKPDNCEWERTVDDVTYTSLAEVNVRSVMASTAIHLSGSRPPRFVTYTRSSYTYRVSPKSPILTVRLWPTKTLRQAKSLCTNPFCDRNSYKNNNNNNKPELKFGF